MRSLPTVPSPSAKAWRAPPPHASILHGRTTSALTYKILLNSITFDGAVRAVIEHPLFLYVAALAACVRIAWTTWAMWKVSCWRI